MALRKRVSFNQKGCLNNDLSQGIHPYSDL